MADTGPSKPLPKSDISEESTPSDHLKTETAMPITEDTPTVEGVATPPQAGTPPPVDTKAEGDVLAQNNDTSKQELPTDSNVKAEGDTAKPNNVNDSTEKDGAENEETAEPQSKADEYVDILGNQTLMKKVIKKGRGPRAQMRERVTITLVASIPVMGIKLPEEKLEFVLGEADVVQALDLAVALMDVGEVAEILSGYEYMYGVVGLPPDIPPKANFKMGVTLHSSVKFDYNKLDFAQKFEEAKKKKERGNFFFKRQEFELAVNLYSQALKIIDPSATKMCDVSADQLQQVLEFRSVIHCNLSATLFKVSAFEGARQSAEESVKIQPSHAKAYVRLGQAQEKLGNPEEAIRAYKKALSLDATNSRWLHNECARLSKVSQKTKETQQKMYSKMFWGSNPPPVNESKKETQEPSTLSSFWKKGGLGLVGAGLVSLIGIGMYRYLNH